MAVTERTASVTVEGDMRLATATVHGNGRAYGELPSSLVERLDAGNGKTSPEDLIASAYAADFAMALASSLSSNGNQPDRLDVQARCSVENTTDGLTISQMHLDVKGVVPRIELERFEEIARKAEERCLVSSAMKGNVEFELTVQLVSG
jgi:osmotically inducible protein OsmC